MSGAMSAPRAHVAAATRRVRTKRRSRTSTANKENDAPASKATEVELEAMAPLLGSSEEHVPQTIATSSRNNASTWNQENNVWASKATEVTTPMPLARTYSDVLSPEPPAPVPQAVGAATSVPFRGLGELSELGLWDGEITVKNTFIDIAASTSPLSPSPGNRTQKLSGDTEPRNFAPQPFNSLDRLQSSVDSPVVISLHQSLDGAAPQQCNGFIADHLREPMEWHLHQTLEAAASEPRNKGANRIQLNLALWVPCSSSRSSAASEPPQRVRLADHLFPVPQTAPAVPVPLQYPTSPVEDASGRSGVSTAVEPTRRRLFQSNSI